MKKGINFKIPLGWPDNCASDEFCAVAKKLLGGMKLNLEATISIAHSFSMMISMNNLKLVGGVYSYGTCCTGLQIVVTTSPSIGVYSWEYINERGL